VYSNPQVASFIKTHFVPVRIHVREQKDEFRRLGDRYGAHWTPTVIIITSGGEARHRIDGFLPAEDFLTQLILGVGHAAFADGQFATAEERFRDVVDQHGFTEAAPEALYWAGVSRYKATNDPKALKETAAAFEKKYPDSTWAKKASVWKE
jgi:thioredoxin-related protein